MNVFICDIYNVESINIGGSGSISGITMMEGFSIQKIYAKEICISEGSISLKCGIANAELLEKYVCRDVLVIAQSGESAYEANGYELGGSLQYSIDGDLAKIEINDFAEFEWKGVNDMDFANTTSMLDSLTC